MKTLFSDIVHRLEVISTLANEESAGITNSYTGGSGMIGMEHASDMYFEPHPCEHALRAFLAALPEEALSALVGLMYAGRDGRKDVLKYVGELKGTFTDAERLAERIEEKSPRMRYITEGIQYLGNTSLDDFYGQVVKKYPAKKGKGKKS